MTKKELIEKMLNHADVNASKADIERTINALTDVIRGELAKGGEVMLPGLGKFSVKQRAARQGRNPATGEAITIPASRAVVFKAAKLLKQTVNN